MELIGRVEAIREGLPLSRVIRHEVRPVSGTGPTLRLSRHGMLRFADCVRYGNRTGCAYAVVLRTVWGRRAEGKADLKPALCDEIFLACF